MHFRSRTTSDTTRTGASETPANASASNRRRSPVNADAGGTFGRELAMAPQILCRVGSGRRGCTGNPVETLTAQLRPRPWLWPCVRRMPSARRPLHLSPDTFSLIFRNIVFQLAYRLNFGLFALQVLATLCRAGSNIQLESNSSVLFCRISSDSHHVHAFDSIYNSSAT